MKKINKSNKKVSWTVTSRMGQVENKLLGIEDKVDELEHSKNDEDKLIKYKRNQWKEQI